MHWNILRYSTLYEWNLIIPQTVCTKLSGNKKNESLLLKKKNWFSSVKKDVTRYGKVRAEDGISPLNFVERGKIIIRRLI